MAISPNFLIVMYLIIIQTSINSYNLKLLLLQNIYQIKICLQSIQQFYIYLKKKIICLFFYKKKKCFDDIKMYIMVLSK